MANRSNLFTNKSTQLQKLKFKSKNATFLKLLTLLKIRRKPLHNGFNSRYAEKFPNADHCQWNGGRLLTRHELERLLNKS
ncbi:hypothetical protein ABDD95_04575 [Mucilaginibacter sp. PAMB04274]|uniref:hypothetical protein n=1 Tax=Mucilaginibacter sp. PAMB04274 TaxID=3138568 RepID=UPI0031F71FA4